jgi:hypothetical protein
MKNINVTWTGSPDFQPLFNIPLKKQLLLRHWFILQIFFPQSFKFAEIQIKDSNINLELPMTPWSLDWVILLTPRRFSTSIIHPRTLRPRTFFPVRYARTILPMFFTSPYIISLKELGWLLHPLSDLYIPVGIIPKWKTVFKLLYKWQKPPDTLWGTQKSAMYSIFSHQPWNSDNPWMSWAFFLT